MTPAVNTAAPPGAMVEVEVDLIDEGRFKIMVAQKLQQILDGLLQYEDQTSDTSASATVTIKFKLQREKGAKNFFNLSYKADTQVPVVERGTTLRVAGGKMLCQPAGTNDGDPDQQLFYNLEGRIIGGVDRHTGEKIDVKDIKDVAGVIKKSAQG
jgi:hypothetical protein